MTLCTHQRKLAWLAVGCWASGLCRKHLPVLWQGEGSLAAEMWGPLSATSTTAGWPRWVPAVAPGLPHPSSTPSWHSASCLLGVIRLPSSPSLCPCCTSWGMARAHPGDQTGSTAPSGLERRTPVRTVLSQPPRPGCALAPGPSAGDTRI